MGVEGSVDGGCGVRRDVVCTVCAVCSVRVVCAREREPCRVPGSVPCVVYGSVVCRALCGVVCRVRFGVVSRFGM